MTLPLDEDALDVLHPALPALCVDLELQLLTAVDDASRCSAVVACTGEVLARFDHLGSPKIRAAAGPEVVISQLRSCHSDLVRSGTASWPGGWDRSSQLFYGLCAHVGFDLADDPNSLFDSPDEVDRQEL